MWERSGNQAAAVSTSEKHFPQKPPACFSLINVVHIIIMCIAPFFMYSLIYSCTHSPDFMFYDCALTCYTTTMMTMMYSHCIHRGIYIYFLGTCKRVFFWFCQQNSFTLKLYRLESSSSFLHTLKLFQQKISRRDSRVLAFHSATYTLHGSIVAMLISHGKIIEWKCFNKKIDVKEKIYMNYY